MVSGIGLVARRSTMGCAFECVTASSRTICPAWPVRRHRTCGIPPTAGPGTCDRRSGQARRRRTRPRPNRPVPSRASEAGSGTPTSETSAISLPYDGKPPALDVSVEPKSRVPEAAVAVIWKVSVVQGALNPGLAPAKINPALSAAYRHLFGRVALQSRHTAPRGAFLRLARDWLGGQGVSRGLASIMALQRKFQSGC